MAKMSLEEAAKVSASVSSGAFVQMKNDGDKVVGFIFHDESVDPLAGVDVREKFFEQGKGYRPYTPADKAAGLKVTISYRMNMFVLFKATQGQENPTPVNKMQILEVNNETFKSILANHKKYGLDKVSVEIVRNGAKGNADTKYTVLPDVHKDKLSPEQAAALAAAKLHDLEKSDDSDDASTDMNSHANGAANGHAPPAQVAVISKEDLTILRDQIKVLPQELITEFQAKFVPQFKLLPQTRLAEALAWVAAKKAALAPPPPAAPSLVDPFAD